LRVRTPLLFGCKSSEGGTLSESHTVNIYKLFQMKVVQKRATCHKDTKTLVIKYSSRGSVQGLTKAVLKTSHMPRRNRACDLQVQLSGAIYK